MPVGIIRIRTVCADLRGQGGELARTVGLARARHRLDIVRAAANVQRRGPGRVVPDGAVSGRYDALQQGERWPVSVSALLSVEGTNNFRDDHAPALGLVASKTYGRRLALYASPTFVWHSITPGTGALTGHEGHDPADLGNVDVLPATITDENTAYVGLGTRLLVPKTTYIVLEFTPRLTGFAPGRGTWGVAVEKHTRGHLFQLNLSNSFGTTYGQLARGGERSNVYLGFNIARKF